MISELDVVVLTRPVAEFGLESGEVGAVVLVYPDGRFETEFVAADGTTVAVVSLGPDDVRPAREREVLHARALAG